MIRRVRGGQDPCHPNQPGACLATCAYHECPQLHCPYSATQSFPCPFVNHLADNMQRAPFYSNCSMPRYGPDVYSLPRPPPLYYSPRHRPSDIQMLYTLRQDLRSLQHKQSQLQSEIHQRQKDLDNVQVALAEKITKAKEIQNRLALVSQLPNEILLMIFEEAVSSSTSEMEMCTTRRISHVSRRWRDITVNSPRLWRHVWVVPHVGPRILDLYVTRACGVLDVEVSDWRDRRDLQRFDSVLETFLTSSGRWRSLSVSYMCDTTLSHLVLKLSHSCSLPLLQHFTFRAMRPGQICTLPFLFNNIPSSLESLDAENYLPTRDLSGIASRVAQTPSKLASLTLRRRSNDARALRIMIDFSAFRCMINFIPALTTLALYGQPIRFRESPISDKESAIVTIPHLQKLILHPGVLKPRYLQHTISSIHAPSLRHFELVFPDPKAKASRQSIAELLFDPTRNRAKFPLVDNVVLHNASNANTALSFINAFPAASHVTIGGLDVGFFLQTLRARSPKLCNCTSPHYGYWHCLRTLILRVTKPETRRVVREWMSDESNHKHIPLTLVIDRDVF